MRAVQFHEGGDPSVLELVEVDRPTPGRGDVLVETRAASVNPIDAKIRQWGTDGTKTSGSDVAGVVESVGDDVDEFSPGDRVFATGLHTGRFSGGTFADYVVVPTDLLAHLPDDVSFEEGAAVALVGVTAWRAFIDHSNLGPGQTAFVHGGSGGVGHVAVGLAAALGAQAVASARPEYHDDVRRFGATEVLDYNRDDLASAAKEATGGADAILDHMPGRYLQADAEIAGYNGDISIISGGEATLETGTCRSNEVSIHPMSMSNLATHPHEADMAPILERIGRLVADGDLPVAIDRTLSLDDAQEAHRAVMEDSILGKIVLVP